MMNNMDKLSTIFVPLGVESHNGAAVLVPLSPERPHLRVLVHNKTEFSVRTFFDGVRAHGYARDLNGSAYRVQAVRRAYSMEESVKLIDDLCDERFPEESSLIMLNLSQPLDEKHAEALESLILYGVFRRRQFIIVSNYSNLREVQIPVLVVQENNGVTTGSLNHPSLTKTSIRLFGTEK